MITPSAEFPDPAEQSPGSFTDYLVAALRHFADPRWLGAHSPLATPYFLGNLLTAAGKADSPQRRGQVLQRVLLLAALALEEPGEPDADIPADTMKDMLRRGTREQQLLYWRFFHYPKAPVEVIIDEMSVAKATYHRNVKEKLPLLLQQMARAIVRLVRPSLRLEPPPAAALTGRADLLREGLDSLARETALTLDGMAGAGKTALAAGMAGGWAGPVFWYTVRPALNDSAGSFLLMLGLFLHTHGSSHLWSQMLVDGEAIQPQLATGLAVADLKALGPRPPLLCVDGTDLLLGDIQRHTALRALLAALAETPDRNAALLFVGQAPSALHAAHLTVPPLTPDAAAEFMSAQAVALPEADQERAFAYTGGNVQALKMLALLYKAGDTFESLLERLPGLPSMVDFTVRLRQRLPADERTLLNRLAVFRQPVSAHAWGETGAALEKLQRRQLVQVHEEGSVSVWPALREALYQSLDAAERALCHRIAATMRTQSGQYTAAAHHYVRSGHPDMAIQVWFPNREQEIRDGQTGAALALLQSIDPAALPEREARTLALGIVQLSKLTGESVAALEAVRRAPWTPGQALTAHAHTMEGDLLEQLSQIDPALRAYEQALATVTGLLEHQEVLVHSRLSSLHMNRFRNLDVAWKEACLARYAAELFQGEVLKERGDQQAARVHYENALQIARELNDVFRQARTHFSLALLGYLRADEANATADHFEQSMRFYTQLGDHVRVERTRTNLAAFFIETQRYHLAIEAAGQALAFFDQVGFSNWAAVNATNLCEAHLAIGEHDRAEDYAQRVIRAEERASLPYVLTSLGHIRRHQGRFDEAERMFNQAISAGEANADGYSVAVAWRGLGQARADQGRSEQARAALERSLELLAPLGFSREIERTALALEALGRAAGA